MRLTPRPPSLCLRILIVAAAAAAGALVSFPAGWSTSGRVHAQAPDPCGAGSNPIVCENSKLGNLASEWDVTGAGDSTIQGFATDISVNRGQTVRFKIDTSTTSPVRLDIYRMGYYGGRGARRITPGEGISATPTNQPNCLTNDATGLVDCGNWSESASWTVPATVVSGIYFARAVRTDTNGASHIFFIVREDGVRVGGAGSDILFQTSDTTWQAYNRYGGNSLYTGSPAGRAYKVSYNRPFTTRGYAPEDWVFNAEYPMVRWLEANGYDVTYTTGVDTHRRGPDLLNHRVFLSVGHDEYWSGGQRASVETARAAGVHLGFFSGNEIFWKTRWENSIDASGTPNRTLVCYKETHAGAKIDPTSAWTGTWRDPRFSPPADGGRPENALTGTIFTVNDGATTSIQVPASFGNLRFWRNTSIANLQPGQTATLGTSTLGYEWDEDLDNGSRPAGLINLSRRTVTGAPVLQDYGSTYGSGTATHSLTLYRHQGGALVFGAGTVQWSWGLDSNHDRGSAAPSDAMQQATVNLFADMGAQPVTLQTGLVPATASSDTVAPTSTITSPVNNATVAANSVVTITGTAADAGGGIVAGVEVSVDGGTTWKRATGSTSWTFSWGTGWSGTANIRSRAFDDSGVIETPSAGVAVTMGSGGSGSCPCSIWSVASVPGTPAEDDPQAVEIGVKFRSNIAGYITGLRYYKSPQNTGTHTGHLWTRTGTLLATATFSGESSSGWQQVSFASPIAIAANTTYVASYHTPTGFYAGDDNYFTASVVNGPLTALADGTDGGNGVYKYGASGFPTQTYLSENYFVDVVFETTVGPDTTPPAVASVSPSNGASGVATGATVAVRFSELMDAATINTSTIELRGPSNTLVSSSISWSSGTLTATLTSASGLLNSTTYTVTVKGGATDPRVKDPSGNALATTFTSTFTTTAPPPPPPDEGPGGPILVVARAANPFTRYYAEILRAEGLNLFNVTDISLVSAATLAAYDVVILGEMPLTTAQVTMFSDWVNAGGNLIAMRPDKQLASLLGLADTGATLSQGYLLVNTSGAPGAGIVGQTIQYHGTADRYTLASATSIAALYATATTATSNPAVTIQSVGTNGGQAAAFTYDLARSIVYTRQGNPAWSGQERDGSSPIRSDDLFFGNAAGDPQPDWINLNKVPIPQADEQQRLLANLIGFMNQDRKPLPRLWYFPRGKKAVVVMTGDDHASGGTAGRFDTYKSYSPPGCSVDDWECVRSTSYVFPGTPLTDAQASGYTADGFEVGLHVYTVGTLSGVNTGCANFTPTSLESNFADEIASWSAQFPSLAPPSTNRTHCIAWSDYTTQASVSLNHNIRFDTNYYYWPPAWVNNVPGFFTGSGMPMRFATSAGTMIDVYQATTQMTDESNQSYPFTIDTLLDRALGPEGYYGAFTANMHTDQANIPQSDAIVQSALSRNVPIVSSRQMLTWLDGRNGSSFGNVSWSGTTLSFAIAVVSGANRLQAMVPATATAGPLTELTRNGSPVAYFLTVIKGVQYAMFDASTGNYQAVYAVDNTPPVVSALSVTPTNTSATITWTTDEPSTSSVDYGTSASLGSSAGSSGLVTSHAVNLAGLTPSTTYRFRVSSTDANNNMAVSPVASNPPASFTTTAAPPPVGVGDSTIVDFSAGTPDANTYFAQASDGEVTLAPAVGTEFSGSTLPTGWSSAPWTAGGTAVVSGGQVSLDASPLWTDAFFAPNRSLDFVATFTTEAFQHAGLGIDLNAAPWAIFSTSSGGGLYARTNNGTNSTDTLLSGGWLGAPHRYGIDWTASGVVYSIDGAQVASHALPIATNLRPIASDLNVGTAALSVDWMRLSPYASSTTFLSRIFDGGGAIQWTSASWTSSVPSGTTLALSVRTGDTPTPDASWTGFSALAAPGASIPAVSRYIQYRAQLGTTDPATTPTLQSVTIGGGAGGGQPSLSVDDVSVTEGNAGTANAVFTVSLSSSNTQTVTVAYATANGTASAGTDYTAAANTLTFAAGALTQTVSVPVLGDTTPEPNETFALNLSNPTNATIARAQGTGTITNDDSPTLSIDDVTVIEGNTGTANAVFTVSLSSSTTQTVTVAFGTANTTASAGTDYTARSGTLTFAAGALTQTVSVPVVGDTTPEPNETFTVNLSNPANATIARAQGTGTITNDDSPTLSIANRTVTEGDTTNVNAVFTVTLSSASTQPVSVTYTTSPGTATANSDYATTAGTLTIPAGATSRTITVPVLPDTVDEANETFTVNLSNPVNATIATAQGLGTITDNDPLPSLTINDLTPTEGNSGPQAVVFTVTLAGATARTVTVNYATANGSPAATAGPDYAATSGTLTFAPGVTTQTVSVTVNGDLLDEADESFYVNLSAVTNASIGDSRGIATIVDNDPSPSLSINDVSILERNTGTRSLVFTVTLSAPSGRSVTVGYGTADGTATAGSDYVATSGTVTFSAGATTRTVSITITGERTIEPNESFSVNLTTPVNATIADPQGVGTILNDD